jgi:hypothetical protein
MLEAELAYSLTQQEAAAAAAAMDKQAAATPPSSSSLTERESKLLSQVSSPSQATQPISRNIHSFNTAGPSCVFDRADKGIFAYTSICFCPMTLLISRRTGLQDAMGSCDAMLHELHCVQVRV